MSNTARRAAAEYEAETVFGEDVTTFATHRLPLIEPPNIDALTHEKFDSQRVTQHMNGGELWIVGPQGGQFKTKMYLTGHGATLVGSPSVDAIETFLGLVFGIAPDLSAAASTTCTGGTAAAPVTAASGTLDPGGLCRIGVLGDGRGNGQYYGIATHVGTALTLVGAMDAAPQAGDVIYPVVQLYGPEDVTNSAVTGVRFRFLSANLRYEMHGCWPMAVAFAGLNPGEVPTLEVTWGVSWFRYTTATFPSAVTSNVYQPASIGAGSLNVQDYGTTTRNKRTYRSLALEYQLNVEPLPGPGGANIYQRYVGARRKPSMIKLTVTEDADAATVTPVLPGYGTASAFKHIEWTGSVTDSSAIGFRIPRASVANIPIQKSENDLNRLTIEYVANSNALVTTNERTLAAFILGNG